MTFIISQILAIIACVLNMISIQCKKRRDILLIFVIANIFGTLGLILLKAYAGAGIQFLFGVQTFINYILDKKNIKITWKLTTLYMILSAVFSIITFKQWIDIIPLISAILHTLTIVQMKESRLRILNLSSLVLWIPYYIYFKTIANIATCLCIIVSNIISIYKYDIKKQVKLK